MLKTKIDEYLEDEIWKKISKRGLNQDEIEYLNHDYVLKNISFKKYISFLSRNIVKKLIGKKKIDNLHIDQADIDTLFDRIRNNKTIALYGTYRDDESSNDGYTNRIKDIDSNLIDDYYRVYIEFEDVNDRYGITFLDDCHCNVVLNTYNKEHQDLLKRILEEVGVLLIHGLHRVMIDRVNPEVVEYIESKKLKVIFDAHGAVPEEIEMNDNVDRVELANRMESYLIDNSDIVICISKAMKDYFVEKHGKIQDKIRIIPVKTPNHTEEAEDKTYDAKHPRTIYCGGVQKWQNTDLMTEIVNKTSDRMKYVLCFAGDYSRIKENIKSDGVEIGYRTSDEIKEEYRKANFGFALRDDCPVNRVASPTKITEYILNGIVPVLKSDKIGDLKKYGLRYIDYKDFEMLKLPNEKEYKEMIGNNSSIIEKIEKDRAINLKSLKKELKELAR